jgi:hypothetical protein
MRFNNFSGAVTTDVAKTSSSTERRFNRAERACAP